MKQNKIEAAEVGAVLRPAPKPQTPNPKPES